MEIHIMNEQEKDTQRQAVRDNYRQIAVTEEATGCCSSKKTACCSSGDCCTPNEKLNVDLEEVNKRLGYSSEEFGSAPDGSNMGLGCGNPQAIAALKTGETVVDLGSGGGFDCFLAAHQVGESGQVIGVDMTAEMISKARKNAAKGNYQNVEFRLGEIEHLPLADDGADVIISNCVINLSPDKEQVFKEAYRVLKTGGRLAISDIVLTADLPDEIMQQLDFYTGCVTGAQPISELSALMRAVGFKAIKITPKNDSHKFIREWSDEYQLDDYITSANIEAVK
jgi:ubiquinone/menaquinone biosynthesis C-methylase UbiE